MAALKNTWQLKFLDFKGFGIYPSQNISAIFFSKNRNQVLKNYDVMTGLKIGRY